MVTPSRRTSAFVIDRLAREPEQFEFVQAVRLLRHWVAREQADGAPLRDPLIGDDAPPEAELLRFHSAGGLGFPAVEVAGISGISPDAPPNLDQPPVKIAASFLGLIGPSGALPHFYTLTVLDRCREKDYALRDYLDLFHHRTLSFYVRVWEKYRHWAAYESFSLRARLDAEDQFKSALNCLIGWGDPSSSLRRQHEFDDEALLYYAGYFAHQPRNAQSLERMLADYWELAVQVLQFQGQWLYLSPADQSSLVPNPAKANGSLGVNVIVGERVWNVEGKFRVLVGPLSFRDFSDFTPLGKRLKPFCQMIRAYVGVQFDFDVQAVLKAEEVPQCQLGGSPQTGRRLGWDSWILSRPAQQDADQPVFSPPP